MSSPSVKKDPYKSANIFSLLSFTWIEYLFRIGWRRPIQQDDFSPLPAATHTQTLSDRLEQLWSIERQKPKPQLIRAIWAMFKWRFLMTGLIAALESAIKITQAVLVGAIVRFISDPSASNSTGFGLAAGIVGCSAVYLCTHHSYFYGCARIGQDMRIALMGLVYKKATNLSLRSLGKVSIGQMVNVMSSDVSRLDLACLFVHFLWVGPGETIAALIIIWLTLGPSTLAGFGLILLLVPIQTTCAKYFTRFRQKTSEITDRRVKTMSEVIEGVRVLKMYAWESPMMDLVNKIRRNEISMIGKASVLRANNLAFFFAAPSLIAFFTFTAFFFGTGESLKPDFVFSTLALFNIVQLTMTLFFSFAIEYAADARVCFDRISNILLLEEKQTRVLLADPTPTHAHTPALEAVSVNQDKQKSTPITVEMVTLPTAVVTSSAVSLSNVTCCWDPINSNPTLTDLTLSIEPGQLVAVVGAVGAGKSSLLMALLGELPATQGNIFVSGSVAYVEQEPWIISGPFRENILFAHSFDKNRYDAVIEACALEADLRMFQDGDKTEIGERGVNLSGGQKARLSLARAAYSDADVYLLDDPLSAVDPGVGRQLFDRCIGGFLKNKTRLLVTHQLQYLQQADKIVLLDRGVVRGFGTFQELVTSGLDVAEVLKGYDEQTNQHQHGASSPAKKVTKELLTVPEAPTPAELVGRKKSSSVQVNVEQAEGLIEAEDQGQGAITWSAYLEYFSASGSLWLAGLLLLACVVGQAVAIAASLWLSYWSNKDDMTQREAWYFHVYWALVVGVVVLGLGRSHFFFRVVLRAAQNLHDRMFSKVIRSPMRFFDANPIGRILNRFSKDLGTLDDSLPNTFFDFMQAGCAVLGAVILICVINPWVCIPIGPLIFVFIFIRRFYLRTSREVKRIESVSRSPVFSHISATLSGLVTIRAFKRQEQFFENFCTKQDVNSQGFFMFLVTSRWLGFRLDAMGMIFLAATAFFAIYAKSVLQPGLVGVSLVYAINLAGTFQWMIRQSAEVENMMTSVERVLSYTRLPSEAPLVVKQHTPDPSWPAAGRIEFRNVTMTYRPQLPPVLENVSCVMQPQWKVGVVGRTGAGKSSMMLALFRLVEISPGGSIVIDGVDVSTIGLHALRSKLSIIPQSPVIFTGSVRGNLDPFEAHSDAAVWEALREVQLFKAVQELPLQLSSPMAESGANFSVGQRQLICLARALLRKNRVLVMDEATANVDLETDNLIQQTIRSKFATCTVVTIAHRLATIIDSDRLLVLERGKLREYDMPYNLLTKGDSYFAKMVKDTGKASAALLTEQAHLKYLQVVPSGKSDLVVGSATHSERSITTAAAAGDAQTSNDFRGE